jgi:hypothetical protein
MLTGTKHGLRVTTTTDALGAFQFDGLIDDVYSVRVVDADGQIGLELVDVENAPGVHAVSLGIMAWPDAPTGFAAANLNDGGALLGVGANPWYPVDLARATVPAGTRWLHLQAQLSGGGDELFYSNAAGAAHSCEVFTATGSPINNGFTYAVLLDDRVIATGAGAHCGTGMENRFSAVLLDRLIDVSAVTFERDAEVRLAVRSSAWTEYGYWGSVGVSVGVDNNFTIRSVAATPGPGPLQVFKEGKSSKVQGVRMIGIPDGSTATVNRWGLAIEYLPEDVTISNVRVFVKQASGASEDLSSTLAPDQTPGVVTLTDVGFATRGGVSPLWANRSEKVEVMVEIQARQADGSTATQVKPLGFAVTDKKPQGWVLRPLYHAGGIPDARRTPTSGSVNRAVPWGFDAWGTKDAYAYVSAFKTLLMFDDLSVEPGGPYPGGSQTGVPTYGPHGHNSHQIGTWIDGRYPGPTLGNSVLDWNDPARRNRWQEAKDNVPGARQEMAAWIRAVRTNLEALVSDERVRFIYIGNSEWNYKPILHGTFTDSSIKVKDETGQEIGPWQPTGGALVLDKIKRQPLHDNHIHVELRK